MQSPLVAAEGLTHQHIKTIASFSNSHLEISANTQLLLMSSQMFSFTIPFLLKADILAWCLDPDGSGTSARVV